jgi:ubiquinone/menaquinone biosynthesis C-methylase UbiE
MDRVEALNRYSSKSFKENPFKHNGCPESYITRVLNPFARRISFLQKNPLLLDLAGGTGDSANYLKQFDIRTVLFDLSEESLKASNSKLKIQGMFGRLPFKKESFDAIHFKDALVHCPDHKVLFEELFRILKPGGKLLIVTPETDTVPHSFIISKETGKRITNYFLSEEDYVDQREQMIQEGNMENREISSPYYPVEFSQFEAEIKNAGFKKLMVSHWYPAPSEHDWYSEKFVFRRVYIATKP